MEKLRRSMVGLGLVALGAVGVVSVPAPGLPPAGQFEAVPGSR